MIHEPAAENKHGQIRISLTSTGAWKAMEVSATHRDSEPMTISLIQNDVGMDLELRNFHPSPEFRFSLGLFAEEPTGAGGGRLPVANQTESVESLDESIRSLEAEKAILQRNLKFLKHAMASLQN